VVPVRVAWVLEVAGKSEWLIVLLDEEGRRALPVGVGPYEAQAIVAGARKLESPRPTAHDLLATVIEQLGGTLERVVIHDLRDGAFIGQLEVRTPKGVMEIDCRPSDGMAVALRTGCPILVDEEVLDKAGVEPDRLRGSEDSPDEPRVWD
jgi:bifunctional DNase/RNase